MTLFETHDYAEFDAPLDSIDDLAHFILNDENSALVFRALRTEIATNASQSGTSLKGHMWSMMTVGILRGLPEARALFVGKSRSYDQICIACKILDHAVAILRGAA